MDTQVSEPKTLKVGTLVSKPSVGLDLTQALTPKTSEPTCYIEFKANGIPDVTMSGIWTGETLKGAIRAMERHYKGIKYSALRLSIKQRQEDEKAKKEATNVPATN